MEKLSIAVMGKLAVAHGAVPITHFKTTKSQALLAYLAVEGQRTHDRSVLAGLFWSSVPERTARNNLRQSLFRLRQALDDKHHDQPFLKLSRNTIQLDTDLLSALDVKQFRGILAMCRQHAHESIATCTSCIEQLTTAIALYRGEFLAELHSADNSGYEEWVAMQRLWLQRDMVEALSTVTDAFIQRAEYQTALHFARQHVALDPYAEIGQRHVMLSLNMTGQKGAALEQYRSCTALLRDELGSHPSAETETLYEQIRAGKLTLQAPIHAITKSSIAIQTKSTASVNKSLPATFTRLIGRDNEMARIGALLCDPNCRMLTITGPIGIGKSALARHAVAQYGSEFSDGVAYVKVEQAATDSELCVALAEVLNLPANVRWHDIVQAVRQQQLLIVLDGCDGSYLTAEKLRMLLHAAPEVKLLIAATKRLNVRGEWTLALTGLSIPTNMAQFEVSDSSAVLLFLYHAKRINRDFELQSHDLQTVAQICQLVDGVPLGIELAANWVRVFTCEEIRQEIAANFHFLTTKQNGIPDHHKSIASAVNLTWQRLAPEERALLRICSIFRGSFSRQAFEEVAGDSVMTLASLLDRSLIERLEDGRFRMPEMLRQFSAEQFSTNTNQRNEIRKRYTQFYASFLATIAPALTGQQQIGALSQREAIERVDLEIANLQQAWRWAIADHNSQFLHGATAFMAHYFEIKGQITEGSAWLTEAEVVFRDEPRLHAILLANLGWFSHLAERSEQALDMLQRATTSLKLTGQQSEIVLPLCKLAIVAHSLGAVDAAHNYLRRSLAVSKTYDDHAGAAWTLFAAATVAHSTGEPERARRLSEQSLGMQQRSGNLWGMAQTLELLGQISFSSCGFIESRRCFEDARFHYGALENTRCVAVCSENLGKVASAIGDWQQAQQYHQDALDVFEKLNDMKGIGRSQLQIGRILRASQAYQAAQKQFLLALKTAIAQQWSQLASTILAEWQNLIHETRHRGIQLTLATAIDTQSGVDDPLVSRLVNQFMAIAQRDYTQQNEAQIDGLVSAYFGSRQTNLQTLSLE